MVEVTIMNKRQRFPLLAGIVIICLIFMALQFQTAQIRDYYASQINSTDNPISKGFYANEAQKELDDTTNNYTNMILFVIAITVIFIAYFKKPNYKLEDEGNKNSEKLRSILLKLTSLRDEGIITNEEYESKRREAIEKLEL